MKPNKSSYASLRMISLPHSFGIIKDPNISVQMAFINQNNYLNKLVEVTFKVGSQSFHWSSYEG